MNSKMKWAVVIMLMSGVLLCFIPGPYLHQLYPEPVTAESSFLSFIFSFVFAPIDFIIFVILSGYFLTCFGLLRSRILLIGSACVIGEIAFFVPIIRYHVGDVANPPSTLSLLAFAAITLVVSLLAGWLGWRRFNFPQQRMGKPLLALLLVACMIGSFTWSGGELLLRGLGKDSEYGYGTFQCYEHPRIALLRIITLLHAPCNKEMVSLIMGKPRNKVNDQTRDEWVYSVPGCAPDVYLVFDKRGWLIGIDFGYG